MYSATVVRARCRLSVVDGWAFGALCSRIPLYAIACVRVASLAPCRSNSLGMVRSSASGSFLFAPSLAN